MPTEKGPFCFSKLFLWPLQEPLNHKAPIIIAVQNPALPSGTSVIVETFYIVLPSAVATSYM